VPTSWSIDLHLPDPRYVEGFEGDAFISRAHYTQYPRPYWVPYRCLYSRNVPNLLMAGRNISVTHEALGTVRVMRTTGMMGEIVGMAASVCKRRGVDPRGVYDSYLEDLQALMRAGVGRPPPAPELDPPGWLADAGASLASEAEVAVSGSNDPERYPVANLTDGRVDVRNNNDRWLSDESLPHVVTLRWERPRRLGAVRIVTGYFSHGRLSAPLQEFSLQARKGADWEVIPETATQQNTRFDWHCRFEPVETDAVRLIVTRVHTDISRIWEIQLFGPAAVPDQ
jgi:hypothetical protein